METWMLVKPLLVLLIGVFLTAVTVLARENDYTVIFDKKTKSSIFVFKAERGDVYFNHDIHQANMKSESCFPCHKTETPTKETTMTRLDQRKAHYFCKGCHHNLGKGPTESHECHRMNK